MLAPTDVYGNDPHPELRPQVLSCSWGNPDGRDQSLRAMVRVWRDAGIFPSFAAGNSGSGYANVAASASFPESFASGAYDYYNEIADFRSWGPSAIDGSIKPEIAAPGYDVTSSYGHNNGYASLDGTSMAQPHIAGTVALLLAKNRSLGIDEMRRIITATTYVSSYMGILPNNIWGWGDVRADSAVASISPANGYLTGRVTDNLGQRVTGAIVRVAGDAAQLALPIRRDITP